MHTNAYEVLDPHDSLFPRARTVRLPPLLLLLFHADLLPSCLQRLGNKFQCVVPEWDPSQKQQVASAPERVYFQPKRSRQSTPIDGGLGPKEKVAKDKEKPKYKKKDEILPRGEEEVVNIIWKPTDEIDDDTRTLSLPLHSYSAQ
jgi:hypothetical protein